ncbi:hypothetical protein LINPERPRIM_LOCUS29122, partial [Linum perenne]
TPYLASSKATTVEWWPPSPISSVQTPSRLPLSFRSLPMSSTHATPSTSHLPRSSSPTYRHAITAVLCPPPIPRHRYSEIMFCNLQI